MQTTFSRLLGAAGLAAAASLACAQTAPIKPGLWQVHMEQDGADMSAQLREMQEQMKGMPPEQRKQVEAMMKQHGVSVSGPGDIKVCLTKDQLTNGTAWAGRAAESGCKTDITRSGNTWKFHSACPAPNPSVTDGEAVFANAESYTMKSTTVVGEGAGASTHRATAVSKWLGADCGEVKPMRTPGKKK